MWNAIQRILPGAMVLAAIVWSTFAGPAQADVKAKHIPGLNTNEVTITTTVPPTTLGPQTYSKSPSTDSLCVLWIHGTIPNARVYASGCVYPPGTYPGGNTKTIIAESVYALEGASGGGNTIEAAPDTLFAGVGLYTPGPKSPANLSTNALRAEVELIGDGPGGVQDAVLVTLVGGGLQTRVLAGTSHQAVAGMKLAVYESEAAANADVGTLGVGAKYFGKADLIGASGQLIFTQGMDSGDWTVVSDGPGKYTAQPVLGRTKTVLVSDKNHAVVAMVGDPRDSTTLPGQSPLGLVLLSIALLAAGIWMMRSRTAAAA